MQSAIVVHPDFDHVWPWAADHLRGLWERDGAVAFVRTAYETRLAAHAVLENPAAVGRLACFGMEFSAASLGAMPNLRELAAAIPEGSPVREALQRAGVRVLWQRSEGFWGQSVAEFALGLTLCGLRRIPQLHGEIIASRAPWNYEQPDGIGRPGQRGQQYGDNPRFTSGTLAGKRVRVVGAGNIGSRYADFCHYLGAEVAVWDPLAGEPCFHRAGARREHFLDRLVRDAEIFAPMLPLTEQTRGLVGPEHLQALPQGCLVVMVTRARICDCGTLYRRVLNDELALAADVFDQEPLGPGHALLGRANVVHTPHLAGRTREANRAFAEMLAEQFRT